MTTLTCEHCNNEYTTYKKTRRFCSRSCSGKSRLRALIKNCEICQSEFKPSAQQLRDGFGRFCSTACAGIDKRGKPRYPVGSTHSYVTKCETCGEEFNHPPGRSGKARFCSIKCRNQTGRWKSQQPRPCEACGDEFTPPRKHTRTCSRACGARLTATIKKAKRPTRKTMSEWS